jgi:hypothetical protein
VTFTPPELPFLVLGPPEVGERRGRGFPSSGPKGPGAVRQTERLTPRFALLETAFEARRIELQTAAPGTEVELVVVLETVGSVADFYRAVEAAGMEFLFELDEGEVDPDQDFGFAENESKPVPQTAFLVFSNQEASAQMLSLWQLWSDNATAKFPRGLARWRQVFEQLRDVRRWGATDRLSGANVLEEWRERVSAGADPIRVEIELWYRHESQRRAQAESTVRAVIEQSGGATIHASVIEEIGYHALLADLPGSQVQAVLEGGAEAIELLRTEEVMLAAPPGQAVLLSPAEAAALPAGGESALPTGEPVVALLDGLPLQQHERLAGRLIIDDPDGLEAEYPASQRTHGTGMASLIVHGDLNLDGPPLPTPVYVRPVLVPSGSSLVARERFPPDRLVVDLLHRAVRRIKVGDPDGSPTAPSIRVVNLSLADGWRPFVRSMSPWARLLDWLAWEHRLLFVLSAGNAVRPVRVNSTANEFRSLGADQRERVLLNSLLQGSSDRRLLAPSESINAITVGALHADGAGDGAWPGNRLDPFVTPGLPAVITPLGPGYRRAIKPELLVAGGRQLFADPVGAPAPLDLSLATPAPAAPPGQLAARPGTSGSTQEAAFTAGTSNSAALASRAAGLCHQALLSTDDKGLAVLGDDYAAIALKALMVHCASWGTDAQQVLENALDLGGHGRRFQLSRFLGYGALEPDRLVGCAPHRATMLGVGTVGERETRTFHVPLPSGLSSQNAWRRLSITLAWLSPVNFRSQRYRRARVWFEPPQQELQVERQQADHNAVRRGTIQHEVLEGSQAAVYATDAEMQIVVACAADAGQLVEEIPFALAVTIEVGVDVGIAVYAEIRDRLRVPVRVGVEPRA